MIYSFRPLPLMKGCRWMIYHLTVHTIFIPMSKITNKQRERERERERERKNSSIVFSICGNGGHLRVHFLATRVCVEEMVSFVFVVVVIVFLLIRFMMVIIGRTYLLYLGNLHFCPSLFYSPGLMH